MDEIYRMLGAQREAELLAEAERLHRGRRPHLRRRRVWAARWWPGRRQPLLPESSTGTEATRSA